MTTARLTINSDLINVDAEYKSVATEFFSDKSANAAIIFAKDDSIRLAITMDAQEIEDLHTALGCILESFKANN